MPDERHVKERRRRRKLTGPLPDPGLVVLDNDEFPVIRDSLATQMIASTTGRRLYATDSGYLGVANQSCHVGDLVYVLLGGDMPYVLRRLSTGKYQSKGETYVHGIMDGEYLLEHYRNLSSRWATWSDDVWLNALGDEDLSVLTEPIVL